MKNKLLHRHFYWATTTLVLVLAALTILPLSMASAAGPNLAAGKTPTGSISIQNAAFVTNGDKSTANYAGQEVGAQWIQIDLGQNYNLNQVNIWHYFGDGRTYRDVIVKVSTTSNFSSGVTTVFNNDTNNSAGQGTGTHAEYAETSTGKTITFSPVSARYVRLWANGSSANAYNHYVEVEVYAVTAGPTSTPTRTHTPGTGPTATRTNTPVGPTPTRTRTPTPPSTSHPANELFDDFSYTSPSDGNLSSFGWAMRNDNGGPGPAGAQFTSSNISFVTDPNLSTNKIMQMRASTSGAGANTTQSEIYTATRKYLEGTYAARFYMTDAPSVGSYDGDEINQTFFTITPLNFNMDPAYSENDFEYLPNGGWGSVGTTMWNTTWETYQPNPWIKDGISTSTSSSFNGWHLLLMTVSGGRVKYYIDGNLVADHGDKYYPETLMSINFNLWFIADNFGGPTSSRTWLQQVDWVYHAKNTVLTQAQVNALVTDFRNQAIARRNTVP
jgi:hypothetical protein